MVSPLFIYNSEINSKDPLVVMILVFPPDNYYIWWPELTPLPYDFHHSFTMNFSMSSIQKDSNALVSTIRPSPVLC